MTDDEQQSFNDLAGIFAENQLAESIHDHEYPYHLDPTGTVHGIGELGFLSVNLPAEHGGLGLGAGTLAGILERTSRVDAGLAGTLFANTAALEIIAAATDSQDCRGVYEALRDAGTLPLAFPVYSSPGESSLPSYTKTDGTFRIFGKADLVVSGGIASYAVVPAEREEGSTSWFLVGLEGKEVKKSPPVLTIGMQSCRPADIEFNGAPGALIGKEGDGVALFDAIRGPMSFTACGIFLGLMRGSFRTALDYCAERYQGGRMIIRWDDMRMKLAGMGTRIAMAEATFLGLKRMFADGTPTAGTSAVAAAIHLGEIAAEVTSEGIQALGGNGYMKDYGQEKRMRDVKQAQCLLGSSLFRKVDLFNRMTEAE
jgi:alkylation response protein AidB-like acyl-CoA dehydrogenase